MIEFKTELLKMAMKIMDYCESNKQMGRACASRIISMKSCKPQERTTSPQGGPDKCRKNVGEGAQGQKRLWVKNAHSKP